MRIADLCCNGRLVSVLEGGYGCIAAQNHKPRTRDSSSRQPNGLGDSFMNRTSLANAAVAHVRRLVDPYEIVNPPA
jgi:hypothetical protein